MRIAFDHQAFAFQRHGGISRYLARLVAGIAARPPHVPIVVAPLHVNAYLQQLPRGLVRGVGLADSRVNRKLARHGGKLLASPLIAATRPDLVHETYYAATSAAPRGVPVVVTVHDMIHEKFGASFAHNDSTSRLKRAAVQRADLVLCVSENTRCDLIEAMPEAADKSVVVRLGFDSFAAKTAESDHAAKPYLLYVGARGAYKNFAGLLDAYATSPRLRSSFEIRCFGGGISTAAEQRAIGDLGIAEHQVRFESGDDDRLAARYRSAAALIYPSLYEGFGIPPLEAMSASCPVIASDRSSIPEVCGDAAAYFIPDNIESIRDAIESVVFDDARRAELITRGHRRLTSFSWDLCTEATLNAYGTVL